MVCFAATQLALQLQQERIQRHGSGGSLKVEFLLKTDSGYPRDAKVFFNSRWQTLGIPSNLPPIGQLHPSPPSPVPRDQARGKRWGFRWGFSPASTVHHTKSARVNTDFPKQHLSHPKNTCFPIFWGLGLLCSGSLQLGRGAGRGAVRQGAKSWPGASAAIFLYLCWYVSVTSLT